MTQPSSSSQSNNSSLLGRVYSRLERPLSAFFDVRVLGVLGQIGFIVLVVLVVAALGSNFLENVGKLGESQFICRDGSTSFKCAYDFMGSEAAFDISETPIDYDVTDSYWTAISVGILNTLKVAVLGIILATILGTFVGIARISDNWLLSGVMGWYIELIRNTPLLIQLVFLYFTVFLALPSVGEALQPLGLPVFLTQRGLNIPAVKITSAFPIWLAFLVLAAIQYQVTIIMLSRQEERTGHPRNKVAMGLAGFVIIALVGWVVSASVSNNEGMLVSKGTRIRELDDTEKFMLQRTGVNYLDELARFSPEEVAEIAFKVCTVRDEPSEANIASRLRSLNVPVSFLRLDRIDQARDRYIDGKCDALVSSSTSLASMQSTLESPSAYTIVSVKESPAVISQPAREGLNIAGGTKLSPEYASLLFGLIIYTAAFIAEIVRSGIQSVSKGQSEAAKALGLTDSQRLQLVVLPQALRVIIPPLTNQYLNLTKNSSLAIAIAFPDLYSVAYTTLNQSGRSLQVMIVVMLTYLSFSLATSMLLNWYNERIKLVES